MNDKRKLFKLNYANDNEFAKPKSRKEKKKKKIEQQSTCDLRLAIG